jgi:uncharacterized protein
MLWLICIVSLVASLLTFYSGFGLGTLLSAVLFVFFDVPSALLITAIVHFLNNLFKMALVYNTIDWAVVRKFGLTSIVGAFLGAVILHFASAIPPLATYTFYSKNCEVTYLKITMAVVMLFFTFFEILPFFKKYKFESIGLTTGGLISGFFGGLSGHQGALRSIFLLKANLNKDAFIGTGVMIACLVDLTRLPLYFNYKVSGVVGDNLVLIVAATLSAFLGAFVGSKLIKKITVDTIQIIVSILIIFIAILLALGIV